MIHLPLEAEPCLNYMLKNFVYVIDGDYIYDVQLPGPEAFYKFNEVKRSLANRFFSRDKKKTPIISLWMQSPLRETAHRLTYKPTKERLLNDEDGVRYVNTYAVPRFENVKGPEPLREEDKTSIIKSMQPVFDHLAYLFDKPDDAIWFWKWIAFNVQFPYKRCKVTPLHISLHHGTGRGWLVRLIENLLDVRNCSKTTMSHLANASGFNDFLVGSTACFIEEVRATKERFAVNDKIRDILTEDRLEVNIKYGKKRTQDIYTNFLFFSNHKDALSIPAEDRRINVFFCDKKPRERSYYKMIYDWLDDETNLQKCYLSLKNLDLSDFNWQTSVPSPAKNQLVSVTHNMTESAFFELMSDPPARALTFKQIQRYVLDIFEQEGFSSDNLNESQLIKLLQNHAFRYKAIKIDGATFRPWILMPGWQPTPAQLTKELTNYKLHPVNVIILKRF
ncbi:MAG: DUF5906 domain-containing protein [Candidatus Thiodiazotropha endolucinida]|nr:DUF5906 domain-containing protein [Candidatus Thiodiazotropha taylori]MCW4324063.1 DUF5906 domain-containing protein [Candidatus Thiodiazotropha taylori]